MESDDKTKTVDYNYLLKESVFSISRALTSTQKCQQNISWNDVMK